MRDPKRIDRILKLIEKIWKKNSNLRFGQLLGNTLGLDIDLYYVEDDKLETLIELTYGEK